MATSREWVSTVKAFVDIFFLCLCVLGFISTLFIDELSFNIIIEMLFNRI